MIPPPVFVTARLNSTRLPRKHFLDIGGISVINHIIARLIHFGFNPYICVPDEDCEAFLDHTQAGPIFGGDPENVEKRLLKVASRTKTKKFHHLDGDDPWFDERAIAMSFNAGGTILPPVESDDGSGICGTTFDLTAMEEKRYLLWNDRRAYPQRLTLDYPEDHHLITAVNRMVGGYMAPRWAVDELFVKNPDLHKINWFRTAEWKARQDAEKSGH